MDTQWLLEILQNIISILLVLAPLLIPQFREFIIKKYQLSLDKTLEDKKASNVRKNYISKVRFDKEFEIYAELSNVFFELVVAVNDSIPPKGVIFKENIEQNLNVNYTKFAKCLNATKTTINKNAVFIPKTFYEKYDEIIEYSRNQLRNFVNHKNRYQLFENPNKIQFNDDEKNITSIINNKFDELNDDIRNHLQSLEVKE